MGITTHPKVGAIVRVDLNEGFRQPEMRKRRPAIVISPPLEDRDQLCTIVPLSTSKPRVMRPFNLELQFDDPLPFPFASPIMWVKADMIMTVAFHRLAWLSLQDRDADGNRQYDFRVLDSPTVMAVNDCIRHAFGWPT